MLPIDFPLMRQRHVAIEARQPVVIPMLQPNIGLYIGVRVFYAEGKAKWLIPLGLYGNETEGSRSLHNFVVATEVQVPRQLPTALELVS